MNFRQARLRLVQAGAAIAVAALVAGCGNDYRPVVSPIITSGTDPQPQSYAVVVSAPSTTTLGYVTLIDYSGDSVIAGPIPTGHPGPSAFTVDASGGNGYTVNSDGTLTSFPVSILLQANQVEYTTLPSNNAKLLNLFSIAGTLWAADLYGNYVDVFTGSPETFSGVQVPVATTPVMVVGPSTIGAQRYFAISQNTANPTGVECNSSPTTGPIGEVTGIEVNSSSGPTTDLPIQVGKCPVYGVESSDGQRLFVLNRGSDTISVINIGTGNPDACTPFKNQSGQTVTCHPTLPLSQAELNASNAPHNCNFTADPTCSLPADGGLPVTAGPVYAEYNAATKQLVVANYDGGTISIIDVSLDEYGDDSATFGNTYTVAVGNNPASVTVLSDGSRAYTANQADKTVAIVNLTSHTVEKWLDVTGHPRTVVSTQTSTQGKVYVASPDSPYLTIIRTGGTDQDTVDTTVLVEGNIVDVRVSTQNGALGNSNDVSRIPGYGQPCNLPGAAATASLAACKALQ